MAGEDLQHLADSPASTPGLTVTKLIISDSQVHTLRTLICKCQGSARRGAHNPEDRALFQTRDYPVMAPLFPCMVVDHLTVPSPD